MRNFKRFAGVLASLILIASSSVQATETLPFVPGGGAGDLTGPAVSTDRAVAIYEGVDGKNVQNSSVIIDAGGVVTAAGIVPPLNTSLTIGPITGSGGILSGGGSTIWDHSGRLQVLGTAGLSIPPISYQTSASGGGVGALQAGVNVPTHISTSGAIFQHNNQGGPGGLYVNTSTGAGTSWSQLTSTIASTLLGLTDTPSSFTGAAGKLVKVSAAETGVEYTSVTVSSDGNDLIIPGLVNVSGGIISPSGSGSGVGVALQIRAGPGGGTGNGAPLDLFAGAGGGSSGDGGEVNISAGLATFKGAGGSVITTATDALGGAFNAPGGDVFSDAGNGVGSGSGGGARLTSGNGGNSGDAGPLDLLSGNGGAVGGGDGGPINIISGNTVASNRQAGIISVAGGTASGFGGSGGPINVFGGGTTHATNPGLGGGVSVQGGRQGTTGTIADVVLQPLGGKVLIGGSLAEHGSLHILADDEQELPLLILENTVFNGGRAEFYTGSFPPTFTAKSGAIYSHNSEIAAGEVHINTSVSSGTSWGKILTDDLATFGAVSTGDAQITIVADTDNSGEDDNPTLLLSQDGNFVQALFGITGQVDFEYSGALANTVFIEAKEAITANHVQIVTGSTVPGGVGSGTVRMTFRGEGPIGVNTNDPDASALMEFASTTQGILPPRLTTSQQDAIASPASGLQLYNASVLKPKYFNGTDYLPMDGMAANVIAIDSQADWDALSAGPVITISADTTLLVRTPITTAKRFDIIGSVNFSLLGNKIASASVFYTGAGTFITADGVTVLRIHGFNRIDGGGTGTFLDIRNSTVFVEISSIGAFNWADLGTLTDCAQFRIPTAGLFNNGAGFKLNGVQRTYLKEMAGFNTVSHSGPWFSFKNTGVTLTIAATISENTITLKSDEKLLLFDADMGVLSRVGVEGNILVGEVGELFDTTGTTGTFTSASNKFIGAVTIGDVQNSAGVARFISWGGEDVYVGQEVVLAGYVANPGYNGTFIVTAAGTIPTQHFEVASIPFGTLETVGTLTRTSVEFIDATTILVDGDTLVLDTTGSTFYDGGFTIYNKQINQFQVNSGFTGSLSGTWNTAGLDQTDPRILADNNPGFLNSKNIAAGFVNANATAHPAIVNGVFSDMAFGTGGVGLIASSNMERWKLINPVNSTFEYTGNEPFDGLLAYDFTSASAGGTQEFLHKWLKDSGGGFVVLPDDVISLVEVGAAASSVSKSQPLTAVRGDQIKPQITRVAGTSSITTSYATVNVLNIAQ